MAMLLKHIDLLTDALVVNFSLLICASSQIPGVCDQIANF